MRDPRPAELLDRLRRLAEPAEALAAAMDFRPLYRPDRHLFAIGFNLAQGKLDNACYDLLASESCLTSYLAVARGEAPRRHWFQLGRPFIRAAGRIGLISWGGTMFEYLMPRLLLRSLPGTLLAEACRTAVARQIEYGRQLGLPWGVSESAFAAQYPDGDYQYQAFGVPGLGLKQGLEKDQVVAPYATVMATMLAPREALENLRRLAQEGAEGAYGFYEAIDYTPRTRAQGRAAGRRQVVHGAPSGDEPGGPGQRAADDVMPRRFHAEPMVRAVELLLQERVPSDPPIVETADGQSRRARRRAGRQASSADAAAAADEPAADLAGTPVPRTHLLSNSHYHVMITNAGSGYSTCRGLDVTRWREDPTCEVGASSATFATCSAGWSGRPDISRSAGPPRRTRSSSRPTRPRSAAATREIETLLEVTVSPEHPVEVRRVTLTNHDSAPRELELTSYAEVVLAPHGADLAHPAFGKLFLETEWLPGPGALLCRRRPRSAAEQPVWAVHVAAVDRSARGGAAVGEVQYETDRMRFLGRGRTLANPAALDPGAVLSGTVGPVLDPIFCLRRRLRLEPGGSAVVALVTAVAESRAEALALADQYREAGAASRAFELAWAHSQVEHRHHGDRRGRAPVPAAGVARDLRRQCPARRAVDPRRQPPGPAGSGGLASRATGRSCWPGSPSRRASAGAASSWPRRPTCGPGAWSSTWSCSTRSRAATTKS